jgi:hypothetical protein
MLGLFQNDLNGDFIEFLINDKSLGDRIKDIYFILKGNHFSVEAVSLNSQGSGHYDVERF